jgi:hypothetical protein
MVQTILANYAAIAGFILLAVALPVFHLRYRRMKNGKNNCIYRQICEIDLLKRQLERSETEKKTLEKIIAAAINNDNIQPPTEEKINNG